MTHKDKIIEIIREANLGFYFGKNEEIHCSGVVLNFNPCGGLIDLDGNNYCAECDDD